MVVTILLYILIVGLVVMVHEVGHFIAARATGMIVEEFSLGMGPKLWSFTRGGVEYMIKLFPIGGYVKILGEEKRVKKEGSFSEKSVGQRMLVAVSGVIMNFLLAVIFFYGVLIGSGFEYVGVPYYEDFKAPFGEQEAIYAYPVTVVSIVENSPAEEAGLEAPFEILEVDGAAIENTEELKAEVSPHAAGEVTLKISDADDHLSEVTVGVDNEGKIGVGLAGDMQVWKLSYSGAARVFGGFAHGINMVKANLFLFGKMISQSVEEGSVEPIATSVAGPVGLVAIVDVVREFGGLVGILDLVAMFNLALLIINLLPFPALDGGHVIFLLFEAVRGKPVDEKIQSWLFGAGMLVLFGLMIAISAKDVFQFGLWDWVKGLFS